MLSEQATNASPATLMLHEVHVEELLSLVPPEVVARYADKFPELSEADVRTHQREMVRFLFIAVLHDGDLTPSPIVDEAWHNFVLHTKLYGPWCEENLGQFVHHVPCIGERSAEEAENSAFTADFMCGLGGDPALWPKMSGERPCGASTCKKRTDDGNGQEASVCTTRCKPGKCSKKCLSR